MRSHPTPASHMYKHTIKKHKFQKCTKNIEAGIKKQNTSKN